MQTSGANSEHKHAKIEHFSTLNHLNEQIITFCLHHHSSSRFRFQIHASF